MPVRNRRNETVWASLRRLPGWPLTYFGTQRGISREKAGKCALSIRLLEPAHSIQLCLRCFQKDTLLLPSAMR